MKNAVTTFQVYRGEVELASDLTQQVKSMEEKMEVLKRQAIENIKINAKS